MDVDHQISPHFRRSEFACQCGCGFDAVDVELVGVLETARYEFGGLPLVITSGNRCETHNASVNGAPHSMHIRGMAADFRIQGVSQDAVADYLEHKYPDCYGIGRYSGRTHIDVRKIPARWDKRYSGQRRRADD